MICPKCGFEQQDADECTKCGIIIKKIKAEQKAAMSVDKALQEDEPEHRIQDVIVLTARYRVQGQIKIATMGYRSRLSDFLNDDSFKFMPILNAKITGLNGEFDISFSEVLVINKDEIIMVIPE